MIRERGIGTRGWNEGMVGLQLTLIRLLGQVESSSAITLPNSSAGILKKTSRCLGHQKIAHIVGNQSLPSFTCGTFPPMLSFLQCLEDDSHPPQSDILSPNSSQRNHSTTLRLHTPDYQAHCRSSH